MRKLVVIFGLLLFVIGLSYASTTFDKSTSGLVTITEGDSWTPTINGKFRIFGVLVNFTDTTDSKVDVILDSKNGATYDTVLSSSGSDEKQSFYWQPDYEFQFDRTDAIRVNIGTADTVGYSITVKGEYL